MSAGCAQRQEKTAPAFRLYYTVLVNPCRKNKGVFENCPGHRQIRVVQNLQAAGTGNTGLSEIPLKLRCKQPWAARHRATETKRDSRTAVILISPG